MFICQGFTSFRQPFEKWEKREREKKHLTDSTINLNLLLSFVLCIREVMGLRLVPRDPIIKRFSCFSIHCCNNYTTISRRVSDSKNHILLEVLKEVLLYISLLWSHINCQAFGVNRQIASTDHFITHAHLYLVCVIYIYICQFHVGF